MSSYFSPTDNFLSSLFVFFPFEYLEIAYARGGVDPIKTPANIHSLLNQFATECGKESGEGGVNTDLENAINLVLFAVLAQPGRELYLTRQVTATQQKQIVKYGIWMHCTAHIEARTRDANSTKNIEDLGTKEAPTRFYTIRVA